MSFLEIKGLTKTYPHAQSPTIESMDFSVEKGDIVVILGPSGCGKSTLLKTIAGLEIQDSGTITIDGQDMGRMLPEKRPVSMVFQKAYLFSNMSVAKNVNYAPRLNNTMRGEELQSETERMLRLVDLEGYGDRKVTELSGGQEQRVSLARALITKPKLLLLDEPFSALDAKLRISMRESLRKICKEIGQTVIFVTHDQQEAVAIGDKVALMMDGKILQYDNPNIFYHRPVSKRSAMFFGWENAIPAVQDGSMVRSPIGEFMFLNAEPRNGDVMLMMHPQAAMCTPEGRFSGTVKEAVYLGTISDYVVDCNGVTLKLEVSCRNMHLVGEEIRFNIDMTMLWPVPDEPEPEPKRIEPKKGMFARIRESVKSRAESPKGE
jgi:ABC-type Fe3+/spermidine/putrescine transport system ATPase subunit